jgi:hypothetical protein
MEAIPRIFNVYNTSLNSTYIISVHVASATGSYPRVGSVDTNIPMDGFWWVARTYIVVYFSPYKFTFPKAFFFFRVFSSPLKENVKLVPQNSSRPVPYFSPAQT